MTGLSRFSLTWLRALSLLLPLERRAGWVEEWAGEILAARLEAGGSLLELQLLVGALRDAFATRRMLRAMETARDRNANRRAVPRRARSGSVRMELVQSARTLATNRGFTLVAILTLGVGVAATTVMFSAVHAVLLRPLPYESPEGIVVLRQTYASTGVLRDGVSAANVRDVAQMAETLSHVAVAGAYGFTLMVDGRAQSLRGWHVSAGFFDAMGGRAAIGRTFAPAEFVEGAANVVVLSHGTWQARFGGDRRIIGQQLNLDDRPHTVVGVLPPEFKHPSGAELWAPRPPQPWDEAVRAGSQMVGVARLKVGVTLEQAQTELDEIATRLAETYPISNANTGFRITDLREWLFRDIRLALLVLFVSGTLVLLIACVNVAHLQLARACSRVREFALRRALGASGANLARLAVVESLLLAFAGGAAGIALACAAIPAVRLVAPQYVPRIDELGVDGAVLGFAMLIAFLATIVAGVTPALWASRTEPQAVLTDGARGTTIGRGAFRTHNRLVVVEIALALVLSVAAGLLVRSFNVLMHRQLGFEPSNRLAVQVFAYDDEDQPDLDFIVRATTEIAAIPGVEAVGFTTALPLADNEAVWSMHGIVPFATDLVSRAAPGSDPMARLVAVDSGYVGAIGATLRDGRNFAGDGAASTPVAIVNETLARLHYPDGQAIGQRILLTRSDITREIVGVIGNIHSESLEIDPGPEIYIPYFQSPGTGGVTFVVKTSSKAENLAADVTDAIWKTDPGQSVWAANAMSELYSNSTRHRRFNIVLLGVFSCVALFLACIGVYGQLSFAVAQRVNELGVRRALGAGTMEILRVVLRQGVLTALAGVCIGLVAAMLGTELLRSLLFGIAPLDAVTFVTVPMIVVVVAFLSALLPAWRACRIDPTTAIRDS